MPVTYCDVFKFLWQSVQAMSCFFDCFRVRSDSRHHPRPFLLPDSDSPASNPRAVVQEDVQQKIRLSSLFADEEREDDCVVKDRENETLVRRAGRSDVHEELVEEARFLKACGTLPQTPAEIRKRVTIVENFDKSEMQKPCSVLESSPDTPIEIQQAETMTGNVERSGLQSAYSTMESSPETADEFQKQGTLAENSTNLDAQRPHSVLKSSPYPTPIRLSDDMQTPGTVFATNMKSLSKGNGRIRSQYVHTVLNPIQNFCQLDELKEENPGPDALDCEGENQTKQENATPFPAVSSGEDSVSNEKLGDLSLSAWLKPPPPKVGGDFHNLGAANFRKPNVGRTPGDRPIIGLVATHWNNEVEPPQISPKGWDGNGIPNSTTKYKEDQKVCWHATPFEERLEKALSEESIVPQRKPITGAPISFEDIEGQDTATSQLQSLSCPKSVVSF